MNLNISIPRFQAFLRTEYLFGNKEKLGELTPCVVFGVSSIPGRAVGFHVLTDQGAMIFRLPVSALALKESAPHLETHILELWNAFSYGVSVTAFDFLQAMRAEVTLRDGSKHGASYMFTLDWYGSADAEDVGDLGHKCGHVLALDNGCIAIQPNNRIAWREPSFVTRPLTTNPGYKTINTIWRCEQHGKMLTEDSDRMFFEVSSAS